MEQETPIAESDSRAMAATTEGQLMLEEKNIEPGLDHSESDLVSVKDNGDFVTISFSSEALAGRTSKDGKPYYELLSHDPGDVDLSRTDNGLPFLMDHDPKGLIGRARNIRFENGIGYADIYFGSSEEAQTRKCDMVSGIATDISFGYTCLNTTGEIIGDNSGIPIVKIRNWKPYEISSVAIPVDDSIGVLRSISSTPTDFDIDALVRAQTVTPEIATPATPTTQDQTKPDSTVEVGITIKESIVMDEKLTEQLGDLTSAVRALVDSHKEKAEPINTAYDSLVTSVADEIRSSKRSFDAGKLVAARFSGDTKECGFELDVQKQLRSVMEKAGKTYRDGSILIDNRISAASAGVRASNASAIALNTATQGQEYAGLTTYGGTVPFLYPVSAAMQAGVRSINCPTASYVYMREKAVPSPKFIAENPASPVAASNMQFEAVTLTPKTAMDQMWFTRQALNSIPEQLNNWVETRMRASLASKMDADYFGLAQSSGTTGVFGQALATNISVVPTTTNKLTAQVMAQLVSTVESKNVDTTGACFVTTPGVYWKAVNVAKPANIYEAIVNNGQSYGYDIKRTQNIPHALGVGTNLHGLVFGKFSDSFFVEYGPLVLQVDENSAAVAGIGQIAVTAFHEYNIGFDRFDSFAVADDLDITATW